MHHDGLHSGADETSLPDHRAPTRDADGTATPKLGTLSAFDIGDLI
jgi:hypothetical protein